MVAVVVSRERALHSLTYDKYKAKGVKELKAITELQSSMAETEF